MSMNLHVDAVRSVTVTKTGKASVQKISFGLWQTPTDVTYAILASPDDKQAYINWVRSYSSVEKYPIYADDDALGEGEPIGYEEVNACEDHIRELEEWWKNCEDEGYEIEFFYL